MSFENWQKFGWLKAHKTNQNEIAELLAVADRDLATSKTPGLHNDWSFNIAYNAALQVATATLAASGYQAELANHLHRVIDSLSLTLGTDARPITRLDIFQKKRNISDCEQRADAISASEVKEMRALAEKLRADFDAWLQKNHPDLRPRFYTSVIKDDIRALNSSAAMTVGAGDAGPAALPVQGIFGK